MGKGNLPKHLDLIKAMEELEDCIFMWIDDGKFSEIRTSLDIVGTEASTANRLLVGTGGDSPHRPEVLSFPAPPEGEDVGTSPV